MKVLSREISRKTADILSKIEQSLSHPICYYPVNDRPNSCYDVFGTVNTNPSEGAYSVWLRESLPLNVFEANLLHEVHHIVQVETGYPMVFNKESDEFNSKDRPFIQEVGSRLASVILDVDVNYWLQGEGYSTDSFSQANYDGAIRNSSHKYDHLDDPLNFANLSLALLLISLSIAEEEAAALYSAYSAYPKVIETVSHLNQKLRKYRFDNPMTAVFGIALLIDTFGLWKYYYVATPYIKVRTHGEFVQMVDKAKGFQAAHTEE